MKILLPFLLCICATSAQAHRYVAKKIIHEEHKLNSGSRPGGSTRAMIKLILPAYTVQVVYAVYATPRNPIQDLGIHTQVRDKIKKDGVNFGIGTSLLNAITMPQADGVTDVLIIKDSTDAANYLNKINEPHCKEDYSRRNVANAIVSIPIKSSKKETVLYLCLRNPEPFEAEYVTVEVVAIWRY